MALASELDWCRPCMRVVTTVPTSRHDPGSEPGHDWFRHAFDSEFRSVAALAAYVSGSIEAGEDIAQEAFAALHSASANEVIENPAAWLRTVAIRRALQ